MMAVWVKCRQRRRSLFLNLIQPSPAVGQCREKKLDDRRCLRAGSLDVPSAFSFCARCAGVEAPTFSLKQSSCPHCGCFGSLNRHSRSAGNDPLRASGQSFRGQRVFCSNRGQRGGCGRTFFLVLSDVLPRHTMTASLLWRWLVEVLAGLSFKAAAEKLRLPFALETVYRLRRGLARNLDVLRTRLAGRGEPPASAHADPLLQTMAHLQVVFPRSACLPAEFQLHFQRPFLG
jgi:hypothetical protein